MSSNRSLAFPDAPPTIQANADISVLSGRRMYPQINRVLIINIFESQRKIHFHTMSEAPGEPVLQTSK